MPNATDLVSPAIIVDSRLDTRSNRYEQVFQIVCFVSLRPIVIYEANSLEEAKTIFRSIYGRARTSL